MWKSGIEREVYFGEKEFENPASFSLIIGIFINVLETPSAHELTDMHNSLSKNYLCSFIYKLLFPP